MKWPHNLLEKSKAAKAATFCGYGIGGLGRLATTPIAAACSTFKLIDLLIFAAIERSTQYLASPKNWGVGEVEPVLHAG